MNASSHIQYCRAARIAPAATAAIAAPTNHARAARDGTARGSHTRSSRRAGRAAIGGRTARRWRAPASARIDGQRRSRELDRTDDGADGRADLEGGDPAPRRQARELDDVMPRDVTGGGGVVVPGDGEVAGAIDGHEQRDGAAAGGAGEHA